MAPEDPYNTDYDDYTCVGVWDRHGFLLADMIDSWVLESDYFYQFDNDGNIVELIWYELKGSPLMKYTYEYDDHGRVTLINREFGKALPYDSYEGNRTVIRYDEERNTAKLASYTAIGELLRHEERYYEDDLLIQVIASNNLDHYARETRKYDESDNLIESTHYDSDGNMVGRSTYDPNRYGKMVEITGYSSDGSLFSKVTQTYDDFDDQCNWMKCSQVSEYFPPPEIEVNDEGMGSMVDSLQMEEYQEWETSRTIIYYDDPSASNNTGSPSTSTLFNDHPDQYESPPYYILYEADLSGLENPQEMMGRVADILEYRLSPYNHGTMYRSIEQVNDNRILVKFFDVEQSEFEELLAILGSSGIVGFFEIETDEYGTPVLDDAGNPYWLPSVGVINGKQLELTSEYIIEVETDTQYGPPQEIPGENGISDGTMVRVYPPIANEIHFDFDDTGKELISQIADRLAQLPEGRLAKQLGIFFGNELICSLDVNDIIDDSVTITGLSQRAASLLKRLIKGDEIPVSLEIIDSGIFEPFEKYD